MTLSQAAAAAVGRRPPAVAAGATLLPFVIIPRWSSTDLRASNADMVQTVCTVSFYGMQ